MFIRSDCRGSEATSTTSNYTVARLNTKNKKDWQEKATFACFI
jgi:hypothetical protein